MKLIGSMASPYVRRVRILLEGQDYDFQQINVFSDEGQKELSKHGPIRRVPILIHQNRAICDSNLICEYLDKKNDYSLVEKQDLIYINELADSGILIFQFQKFDLDVDLKNDLTKNHLKRIEDILKYFDKDNLEWNTVGKWLYCVLDWFSYRNIFPWESRYKHLYHFIQKYKETPIVKSTDPRIRD